MTLQTTMQQLAAECGWTEGDWTLHETGIHLEVRSDNKSPVVNWLGFDDSDRALDEHYANARVLAASTKLAAALYNLLRKADRDAIELGWYDRQDVDDAIDALSSAGVDTTMFGR